MAIATLEERIRKLAMARGISPDVAAAMLKSKLGAGILNQLADSAIEPAGGAMSAGQSMDVGLRSPNMGQQQGYQGGDSGVSGSSGWGSSVRDWGAGIGNQMREMVGIQPAGGPQDPNMGAGGSGGFGEYGGVPLGVRLATLGGILSNYGNFDPRMLSPLVAAREASAAQAQQEKLAQQAERIASNLDDTNPVLADAIRMNPALVKDYITGQMDLDKSLAVEDRKNQYSIEDDERDATSALELEGKRQEGTMEVEKYKVENSQDRIDQRAWNETINTFKTDAGLEKSGTVDIWRQYTGDENLNETEARALASAKTEKTMWEKYNQMVDNRTKKKEVDATTSAAALAGIKLAEGDYIVNQKEIIEASAKGEPIPEPIVKPMQGTKRAAEQAAIDSAKESREENDYMAADATVGAIDRATAAISRQEKGESQTGVGWTGVVGRLPGPHEAGNVYDEFQIIRANLGFEQLQKLRDQSPTGGALGPVSDYENRLLQSTIETLDQTREPAMIKGRLDRLRVRYSAVMTASEADPSKSVMMYDVEMLQSDPSKAALFDDVYGEGAAATVLGK